MVLKNKKQFETVYPNRNPMLIDYENQFTYTTIMRYMVITGFNSSQIIEEK